MIHFDTNSDTGYTVAIYANDDKTIVYDFPAKTRDGRVMCDAVEASARAFGLADDGTLNGERIPGVFWEREDFRLWLRTDGREFMESFVRLCEL